MKSSALFLAFGLAAVASPVVQVRDLPHSPTVAIVAWDSESPGAGLRTRLLRDGSVLGEARRGEHGLYLSSVLVDANGGFAHAVAQDGKLLRMTGKSADIDACRFDNVCSPREIVGLGVPDEWLRQHRDSIVVTLRPRTGHNWTVRLDGALIDSYLRAIDSVSAALKKP
jgi:hypothetical protein